MDPNTPFNITAQLPESKPSVKKCKAVVEDEETDSEEAHKVLWSIDGLCFANNITIHSYGFWKRKILQDLIIQKKKSGAESSRESRRSLYSKRLLSIAKQGMTGELDVSLCGNAGCC